MSAVLLSDTLLALVGAVDAAPSTGLRVTEVDMSVPLEATAVVHDGELVICGSVQHTREAVTETT